jgi:hypothetical protein
MFDTYVLPRPQATNVHIEQRPHDAADAARLYGECEAKAKAAVSQATIQTLGAHNEIKVVAAKAEESFADCNTRLRVMFMLNGKQYEFHSTVDSLQADVAREIGLEVLRQVARLLHIPPARIAATK